MPERVGERDFYQRMQQVKIGAQSPGDVDMVSESLLCWVHDPDEGSVRAAADGIKAAIAAQGEPKFRGTFLKVEDFAPDPVVARDNMYRYCAARYERTGTLYRPATMLELDSMLEGGMLGRGSYRPFLGVTSSPSVACRFRNFGDAPCAVVSFPKEQLDPFIVHPEYTLGDDARHGEIAGPIPGFFISEEEHRIPAGRVAYADLDMTVYVLNAGDSDAARIREAYSALGDVRFASVPRFENGRDLPEGVPRGSQPARKWGPPETTDTIDAAGMEALGDDAAARDYLNSLWTRYSSGMYEIAARMSRTGAGAERRRLLEDLNDLIGAGVATINTFYLARYERADKLYYLTTREELDGGGGYGHPFMSVSTSRLALSSMLAGGVPGRTPVVMEIDKAKIDRHVVHQRYHLVGERTGEGISDRQYAYFAAEEEHRMPTGAAGGGPGRVAITEADVASRLEFLPPPHPGVIERMGGTFAGWLGAADAASARSAAASLARKTVPVRRRDTL